MEDQDFTQPFRPGTVLNLVFGKVELNSGSPFIEVWAKDPVSGTVTTKHFREEESSELFAFMLSTLRIMNLRNKVLHKEQQQAITQAQLPRSSVKKKKSTSSPHPSLSLDDLLS